MDKRKSKKPSARSAKTISGLEKAASKSAKSNDVLRLYVDGTTTRSAKAVMDIKNICEEHLRGRFELEVIDLYQQPVLDDSGNVTSIAGFSRDMTEHKRIESQNRHLASFPRLNPNAVLEVDALGIVTYANQAAMNILKASGVEEDPALFLPDDMRTILSSLKSGGVDQSHYREVKICDRIFGERIYIIPELKVGRIYTWEITESKKAEEARRRITERFKLLSDISGKLLAAENPQGIVNELCSAVMTHLDCQLFFNFVADPTVDRLRLNAYAGIPPEEGAKLEWLDYGAAVCGCVARNGERIIAEDIQHTVDERTKLVKKFGTQAYACHPLRAGGRVIGTLSFGTTQRPRFTDEEISMMKTVADQIAVAMERIQSAETIRESESHLSRAQEIAHLGSWELDLPSNRLTWSDEVYRIFGLEPKQFEATYETFLETVHPDDRSAVDTAYSSSLKDGRDSYEIEHRIVRKNSGQIRVVHERCRHIRDAGGRVVRSIGMVHDITERRDLEEALRASRDVLELRVQERTAELMRANLSLQEEIIERARAEAAVLAEQKRFHDVLDDLPVYVILLTPDHHARFANREFVKRFGDSVGRTCYNFLFGRDTPCERCDTYKVLETNEPQRWEWTGPDGKNYDIYDYPFTDVDGSSLILEMGVDITEKKKAEEALRLANVYNRSLIEASLDPLVTIGPDGKITDVNLATETATGCSRAELIGTDFSDYFTEPSKARAGYRQVFDTGSVRDYELNILNRNGQVTPVLYNASLYRDESGTDIGVFAAARDMTALKAGERRRELIRGLLELFARKSSSKEYLDSVAQVISDWTGCDALGIRITDETMHIPYNASVGFDASFMEVESNLSLQTDSCLCLHSISGACEAEESALLTSGGSFRCPELGAFVECLPDNRKSRYRGTCLKFGYHSVTVVPIRYRDQILGAIHLADHRQEYFSASVVEFLETVSPLIGEAVFRFYTESELAKHRDHLEELVDQRTTELESVNNALSATRDYLENLLNYANAPIIVWDKDYCIVRFNHAFERLTGRSTDEVIGTSLDILFPPATSDQSMGHIRRAVSGERWEVVEIPIVHKNGSVRTVLWNSATLYEADGSTPAATIAQGQDITERKLAEEAVRAEKNVTESMVQSLPGAFYLLDQEGRFIRWNKNFEKVSGYSASEFPGMSVLNLFAGDDRSIIEQRIREVFTRGESYAEVHIQSKDGQKTPYFFTGLRIMYDNRPCLIGMGVDITERKKLEGELNQLNRTLKARSDSNQALMRAANETDYLNDICRIILDDCGHTLVWVGFKEDDEKKSIQPVASAGFEEGYLSTLNLTWSDSEHGHGPTGTAVRTGKPTMCRNILTDPNFAPWREEAVRRGYSSSIVLPLISDGLVFGAINIYSKEPDPFTEKEVQLLVELADDLSYGISSLRLREAHALAEEEIQKSEKRYRELFNSMTEGFAVHEIICDDKGKPYDYRYLEINPAFEHLTGLTGENVIGKTHNEIFPGNDPIFVVSFGKVALTGEPVHLENYVPPLGKYFEIFAYRTAPLQFATVFIDVTERIQAQEVLIQREREYRLLMEEASDGIVLIDKSGYLISANPRACKLLGYRDDEIAGRKARKFLDLAELATVQDGVGKLKSGESIIIEHRLITSNGSSFYVETNTRRLADGRYQTIIRDISERKKAEEEFTQAIKTQVFERLFTTLHEFRHGEGLAMNLHRLSLFAKNIDLFDNDKPSGSFPIPDGKISPRDRLEVAVNEYKTVGYQSLLTIASLIRTIEVELNQKVSGVEEPVSGRNLESLTITLKSEIEELLQMMQSKTSEAPAPDHSTLANKIAGHVETLLREIQMVTRQLTDYFTSDVGAVLESIVDIHRIGRTDIPIDIENFAAGRKAIISPNELGDVLSLLITNSVEALSGFGTAPVDRKQRIIIRLTDTGKGVKIEVEDTGGGVPADIADLIFSKGYSTKGGERGRGLAYLQGHLSKYGGTISYDKAFHEGARFSVELVSP